MLSGGKNSHLAVAGDILLAYDSGTKLMIVDKAEYNTSAYPLSQYTDIGTVAVPGTHNVYNDGSCGVVNSMSGPNTTTITFGQSYPVYSRIRIIGSYYNGRDETHGAPKWFEFHGERPLYEKGSFYLGMVNPPNKLSLSFVEDTKVAYFYDVNNSNETNPQYAVPSPYGAHEEQSEEFLSFDKENVLSDFDGLGHSKGFSISSPTFGPAPGATVEEKWKKLPFKKDWYIPTLAEMAYILRNGGALAGHGTSSNGLDISQTGLISVVSERSVRNILIHLMLRVVS